MRVQVVYDEPAPLDDYEGVDVTRLTRELTPEEPVRAQPDAHHRRRQADRRSEPQLVGRPALHRRRARRGQDPVPLRQPRVASAAQRRGDAGRRGVERMPATGGWSRRRCASACTRTTGASSTAPRCASSSSGAVAAGGTARGRRSRPRRPRRMAAGGRAVPGARRASCSTCCGPTTRRAISTRRRPQPLWLLRTQTASRQAAIRRRSASRRPRLKRRSAESADECAGLAIGNRGVEATEAVETASRGPEAPRHADPPRNRRRSASCSRPTARAAWRSTTSRWAAARSRCGAAAFRPTTRCGSRVSQVPVDAHGNFAAEEILPAGAHTVEVAVLDDGGNGSLYLRDLEFKRKDWFYVGLADLTVVREPHERAGRAAAGRQRAAATTTRRSTAGSRST